MFFLIGRQLASTRLGCISRALALPVSRERHGKLVDNFSHESDVTSLQDPFTSRPQKPPFYFIITFCMKYEEESSCHPCMLCIFLSRPSSVLSWQFSPRVFRPGFPSCCCQILPDFQVSLISATSISSFSSRPGFKPNKEVET